MQYIWPFEQTEYEKKHYPNDADGGSCAALSARWAKLMLKCQKDSKFVPQVTVQDRELYVAKGNVPGVINRSQLAFDAGQRRSKSALADVVQSAKLQRAAADRGEMDGMAVELEIQKHLGIIETNVARDIATLLGTYKLTGREETQCRGGFTEYWNGCQANSCYIFLGNDIGHAMAGYVTGGSWWWNYHFFDPNVGEYIAEGDKERDRLMASFANAYQKRTGSAGGGRRLKLSYVAAGDR